MGALAEVLKLLLLSVVAVAVLRRLRLPPIIGYVLVGAAAGPNGFGWLEDSETIHFLGEVGIAFLLFTLGLEFSIRQFAAMRKVLLVLGGSQVLLVTASGAAIAWMSGLSPAASLVIGGAIAMSSTAIVIKQLRDQLELQTTHGRLAVGILLFQDLAAIPFLVVIPIVGASGGGALALPLLLAFGKAIAVLVAMLAIGRYALRPILHEAGASTELFTLTALLVSLAAAWTTQLSGLSLAFGAFVAGMMLSETEYRHQVENEIRPFRDVLLGLFFVFVGMRLEPAALTGEWKAVLLLFAGLAIGKGVIVAAIARLYGYRSPEAIRAGLVLAQGGEFSVALLALAVSTRVFDVRAAQPVLAAVVLSMLVAPLVIRRGDAIVTRLFAGAGGAAEEARTELAAALHGTRDHILVCGYGRVGSQLARLLEEFECKVVALDTDPGRVKQGWDAGREVYYGDASQKGVLQAAGVKDAKAVAITFDHLPAALRALHEAREANPRIAVLARASDQSALDALRDAGVTEAVPETMEASLMLATQMLLVSGMPGQRVLERMQEMREERYRSLV
ncbi:MAG TPA: cation:proton antiporter [Burkholderiales bacterium]|nr:cation:proton antiporter [Burkholderiales bacterium]